jgi:hypothetical protein
MKARSSDERDSPVLALTVLNCLPKGLNTKLERAEQVFLWAKLLQSAKRSSDRSSHNGSKTCPADQFASPEQ